MFSLKALSYMDWRVFPLLVCLMGISLFTISAADHFAYPDQSPFFTGHVLGQIRWFVLGWLLFFFCTCLDYNRLREWTWGLYLLVLLALVGLFFTEIGGKNVQRWYRLPALGATLQPSEFAKLTVVFALSWWFDRKSGLEASRLSTAWTALIIVGIPFLLIYKQPDLGTAMLLYPITLALFYFGNAHPKVTRALLLFGFLLITIVLLFFLRIVSHQEMHDVATTLLKEYQYERLNPDTHHQKAAITAIGVGGWAGTGWKEGFFMGRGWLPEAHTDSIVASFGEEFGLVGLLILLTLFYLLLYFSFQVCASARNHYGSLLAAGISIFLASHILINVAMMCGLWPITGVPLLLMSYGGSSTLVTMSALGILQSIYSRRFAGLLS